MCKSGIYELEPSEDPGTCPQLTALTYQGTGIAVFTSAIFSPVLDLPVCSRRETRAKNEADILRKAYEHVREYMAS